MIPRHRGAGFAVAAALAGALLLAACLDLLTVGFPAPRVVEVGDSVSGTLAPDGVEEFGVRTERSVRAGAFVQAVEPREPGTFRLELRTAAGSLLSTVKSGDADTALFDEASSAIEIVPGDVYRITVASEGYRGGFRFHVFPYDDGPEGDSTAALDQVVVGRIEPPGDEDRYRLAAEPGDEFSLVVRSRSNSPSDTFAIRVRSASGGPWLAEGLVWGPMPEDSGAPLRRVVVEAGDSLEVVVRGFGGRREAGEYEFRAARLSRAPEAGDGPFALHDTVYGVIGLPGDVDEYTFALPPGALVNAFIQVLDGAPWDLLFLEVPELLRSYGTGRLEPLRVVSWGSDTNLWDQATDVIALAQTETHTVRVRGGNTTDDVGRYRIQVVPVNSTPETAAPDLVFGVSVAEALDYPGDVDVFSVPGADGEMANAVLEHLDPNAPRAFSINGHDVAPGETGSTGRVTLGPDGVPWFFVEPDQSRRSTGPYRLTVVHIDPLPEAVDAALVVGQTIVEPVDFQDDLDRYVLSVSAGDIVRLRARFQPSAGGGYVRFGFPLMAGRPGGMEWSGDTTWTTFRPVEFLEAGTHLVEVAAGGGTTEQRGPYELRVRRVSRAPEQVPVALTIGTVVSGERTFAGDVDEFTFGGTAGQLLSVLMQPLDDSTYMGVRVYSSDRGDTVVTACDWLSHIVPLGSQGSTGVFAVPADGQYVIEVRTSCGNYESSYSGAYALWLAALDPAPEVAGAMFALDDTVTGESLHPVGDVDEFRFTGAAGDEVVWFFDAIDRVYDYNFWVDVVDETTDDTVFSSGHDDGIGHATLDSHYDGPHVLPSTGSYLLRVSGLEPRYPERAAWGEYAFQLWQRTRTTEAVPSSVTVGDSVGSERIDRPLDVDEFVLQGTQDQQIELAIGGGSVRLTVVDMTSGTEVGTAQTTGATASTGRLTLPSTGQYLLRVEGIEVNWQLYTGPYWLRVDP